MPIFRIPQGQSQSGSLATKNLFQQTVTQNKERSSVYKRWSEKATIVSFNESVETYDIVVTSVSYTNNQDKIAKVNRTIRNVRSIIPTSVYTFKPGETVLIGYILERRESPVILGLKAAKASQQTTIVTDGDESDGVLNACSLQITDLNTGEDYTNYTQVVANCSSWDASGTMDLCLEAVCGAGELTWSWDAPSCLQTSGEPAWDVTPSGMNNRRACFRKTTTTSTAGTTWPCMAMSTCIRFTDGTGSCGFMNNVYYYNYAGTTISSTSCESFFGGTCAACLAIHCEACYPTTTVSDSCPTCQHALIPCDLAASIPNIANLSTRVDEAYVLGYNTIDTEGGALLTVLSDADITNNTNGTYACCMCQSLDNSTISVTDEKGNSWSVTLRIQTNNQSITQIVSG